MIDKTRRKLCAVCSSAPVPPGEAKCDSCRPGGRVGWRTRDPRYIDLADLSLADLNLAVHRLVTTTPSPFGTVGAAGPRTEAGDRHDGFGMDNADHHRGRARPGADRGIDRAENRSRST